MGNRVRAEATKYKLFCASVLCVSKVCTGKNGSWAMHISKGLDNL